MAAAATTARAAAHAGPSPANCTSRTATHHNSQPARFDDAEDESLKDGEERGRADTTAGDSGWSSSTPTFVMKAGSRGTQAAAA